MCPDRNTVTPAAHLAWVMRRVSEGEVVVQKRRDGASAKMSPRQLLLCLIRQGTLGEGTKSGGKCPLGSCNMPDTPGPMLFVRCYLCVAMCNCPLPEGSRIGDQQPTSQLMEGRDVLPSYPSVGYTLCNSLRYLP